MTSRPPLRIVSATSAPICGALAVDPAPLRRASEDELTPEIKQFIELLAKNLAREHHAATCQG